MLLRSIGLRNKLFAVTPIKNDIADTYAFPSLGSETRSWPRYFWM